MLAWYFRDIEHIEHWLIRSWALEYTQKASFIKRSDDAREAALKIKDHAVREARRIHSWWHEGARPENGFNHYFEEFLRIGERLAGLESILDKHGELSSVGQDATEVDIPGRPEFIVSTDTPLDEVLFEARYWYPDWFGCDQHKRAALTGAIEASGKKGERIVCSSLASAADVEYFDAASAAAELASMYARLKWNDQLLALLGESVAHFKRRFSQQASDVAFAESIQLTEFHSLDLEDVL